MKGLLGAATVMGTLMYLAGHVWEGHANFYLHEHALARAPTDEEFVQMLATNCCLTGPDFPPPAIAEVLQDCVANYHKVRRLHLIVVDLWRPWRYNARRAKAITDQLWFVEEGRNSKRMSPFRPCGPKPPPRCRRFAFGYALDNSEFPCYLVWPQRDGNSYALLDTATNDTLQLSEQSLFRPLGMHHFYDSFALVSQIGIREDALVLFDLREEELLSDLHITKQAVLRKRYVNHPEQFLDQHAQPVDRNNVPADVLCLAAGEAATDSGDEEASIATADTVDSSTDQDTQVEGSLLSPLAEDIEQHELMTAAYSEVGRNFDTPNNLLGENYDKLQRLEMVPHRWPLARLSIPLQKIVDRLTRVVAGCCWEVMVTRLVPLESLKSLRQVTKRISMLLAGDLAKEVAAIFRKSTPILQSSFMMIQLYICCAPIIGSSPSIRNCCTPHRDTMPP